MAPGDSVCFEVPNRLHRVFAKKWQKEKEEQQAAMAKKKVRGCTILSPLLLGGGGRGGLAARVERAHVVQEGAEPLVRRVRQGEVVGAQRVGGDGAGAAPGFFVGRFRHP